MRRRPTLAVVAAVFGVSAAAVVFADGPTGLRSALVLPFLLAGPGLAWVQLLSLGSFPQEMAVALALSIAADTLVSTIMLYAGLWHPKASLVVLVMVSLVGVAASMAATTTRPSRQVAV